MRKCALQGPPFDDIPLLLLLLLLSGPRAYAPDAPQPCRLIVLPSYYSSVFDVPTFFTGPSSSSM